MQTSNAYYPLINLKYVPSSGTSVSRTISAQFLRIVRTHVYALFFGGPNVETHLGYQFRRPCGLAKSAHRRLSLLTITAREILVDDLGISRYLETVTGMDFFVQFTVSLGWHVLGHAAESDSLLRCNKHGHRRRRQQAPSSTSAASIEVPLPLYVSQ